VVIGDGHGVAKISLWEDDVGMLQRSKSYRFERMVVKEYRGKMQLSTAPDSTITLIQDLDVEEVMEGLKLLPSSMENAKVIGVLGIQSV